MQLLCPHCQSAIELGTLPLKDVVCPSCGSSFHLDGGSTTGHEPAKPERIGKFELLAQVGQGAFGTVYKARDPELDRVVAIKVPRAHLSDARELDRFLREARSVAQLRHPAIVPVHEVGQAGGVPYLVCEFVSGITLDDRLTDHPPLFRESAGLVAVLADALHYAHERGVVHRDVKPSNVMLDAEGRPHLMDFGLARREAGEVTMTVEGQVLGTPAYMSPEQARGEGHTVDGRTDVYSLGVMLYRLLAGELPFRGNMRMLLHHVLHDEPRPPRSLNDQVPRDLETICLKAMSKEPAKRYASARELAEDLRRFLAGEAIRARPAASWEKAWRWARRRPTAAALLVVSSVMALALVGLGVGGWYHQRLREAYEQTVTARREAERQRKAAEEERDRARLFQYYHHIALAHSVWLTNDLRQMGPLLDDCPTELRGWEWRYLQRLRHADLFTVPFLPNLVIGVAVSPDGTSLAVSGTHGLLEILDAATGRVTYSLEGLPADDVVFPPAFSPDGKRLASPHADGTVRIWNLERRRVEHLLRGHTKVAVCVAFDGSGKRLVSSSRDHSARVWDTTTGDLLFELNGHTNYVTGAAISPDGTRVVTASEDQTVRLWDLEQGGKSTLLWRFEAQASSPSFSPDGFRVAASDDRTIIVWDTRTREPQLLQKFAHPPGLVHKVVFSPDGERLASCGVDQAVRLWDPATGLQVSTFRGHSSEVLTVAFSPDGTRLVSASPDGTVKAWSTAAVAESRPLRGHTNEVWGVACSPDGKYVASGSFDGTVKLWDVETGAEVWTGRSRDAGRVTKVAFSPDGRLLASGNGDGTIDLWQVASGKTVRTLGGHADEVCDVAFSPEGKRLASASWDKTVRVWEPEAGRAPLVLKGHSDRVLGVAFSPGGELASAGADDVVIRWDLSRGKPAFKCEGHVARPQAVAYSPNGEWLASAGDDNRVGIWHPATGEHQKWLPHAVTVFAVAFSPDSRRLATVGPDCTLRVWDTSTWQEALTLRGHTGSTGNVTFSHDGTRLVSASTDGTVKVWDGRPVTSKTAAEIEALGLLDVLFARPLSKADVRAHLNSSTLIRPAAKALALSLVESHGEVKDAESYRKASWAIARQPHLNQFQYHFALRQAESAWRLAPKRGSLYRTTLGAAQYRAGKYADARQTLGEADPQKNDTPAHLAFLSMAQYQDKQPVPAKATLDRLKQAMKKLGAVTEEDRALWREAERLLEGKPTEAKK